MLLFVPDMETTYISAADAADYTGLSQRRINQLVRANVLPSIRIGNSNAIEEGSELEQLRKRVKAKRATKKNGNKRGK